jgi:hypothetical protein
MSTGCKNLNFLLLYLEDTRLVPPGYHNKKFLKNLLQQFLCQVNPSGYGIPKIISPRPWGQLILAMPPPCRLRNPTH